MFNHHLCRLKPTMFVAYIHLFSSPKHIESPGRDDHRYLSRASKASKDFWDDICTFNLTYLLYIYIYMYIIIYHIIYSIVYIIDYILYIGMIEVWYVLLIKYAHKYIVRLY